MRKWWWTAVAVVIAASACTADEGPSTGSTFGDARDVEIDGVPFLDGATLGPGDELRDGITVVEGSRVLGGTMPVQYFAEPEGVDLDHGWRALAVVTGDARQVLDDYASQAAWLDLAVPPVFCVETPAWPEMPSPTVCAAESRSADGLRSFRLDFVRSPGHAGFEPVSHAWISRQDMSVPPIATDFVPPFGTPVEDPGRGSDLDWIPLAEVGEAYEPPTGSTTPTSFVVQEGTRLIGPPGSVAVLAVVGDVDQVVDRFRTAVGPAYENHTSSVQDGVQVDRWYWTNGDTATVEVYRSDDRPTFMVVSHTAGD